LTYGQNQLPGANLDRQGVQKTKPSRSGEPGGSRQGKTLFGRAR
jgi:hypothetical protein